MSDFFFHSLANVFFRAESPLSELPFKTGGLRLGVVSQAVRALRVLAWQHGWDPNLSS